MTTRNQDLLDLTGTWLKDEARSDSMDQALNLTKISGLVRQAMKLINGVKIKHTQDTFNVSVTTIFSWFSIKESYVLDGQTQSVHKRRDLRAGDLTGTAHANNGKVRLQLSWSSPLSGSCVDNFQLNTHNELSLKTTVKVESGETTCTTIYHRKHE